MSCFPARSSRLLGELPAAYFEDSREAYRAAEKQAGSTLDLDFSIAGHHFRLKFADPELAPRITRAIQHLALPSAGPGSLPDARRSEPELTVHLWTEHPATELTRRPAELDARLKHSMEGSVIGLCSDGRYRALREEWLGIDSTIDLENSEAYYFCRNAHDLPLYETTAPLRPILGAWLAGLGLQIVHAAAVGTRDGGILLAGKGGSGKSSTALTALEGGWSYLSDDLCVIQSGTTPMAYALYNTLKLRIDALQRFPQWESKLSRYEECGEEKAIAFLHEVDATKLIHSFPLRALLIPHVQSETGSVASPAAWGDAMKAVVPWSLTQVPGSSTRNVDLMFRVVSRIPAFRLALGSDQGQLQSRLREFLG